MLASYIYEPDVALFSEEILAYAHADDEYDMKQVLVSQTTPTQACFMKRSSLTWKTVQRVLIAWLK